MSELRNMLQDEAKRFPAMGLFPLLPKFVLSKGVEQAGAPLPKVFSRGKSRECFRNSAMLAMVSPDKYTYVEGFALPAEADLRLFPYHHAWLLDKAGNVIDVTWGRPERCEYMGVPFPTHVVSRSALDSGVFGLLDKGMGPDSEFIFQHAPDLQVEYESYIKSRIPVCNPTIKA